MNRLIELLRTFLLLVPPDCLPWYITLGGVYAILVAEGVHGRDHHPSRQSWNTHRRGLQLSAKSVRSAMPERSTKGGMGLRLKMAATVYAYGARVRWHHLERGVLELRSSRFTRFNQPVAYRLELHIVQEYKVQTT